MTSILKFYKDLEKYGLIKDSQFILNIPLELLREIFDDVELLHKQEIIDAAERWKGTDFAERYYEETFGSKGSYDTLKENHIVDTNEMVELPQQDVDKLGNEDVPKLGYDVREHEILKEMRTMSAKHGFEEHSFFTRETQNQKRLSFYFGARWGYDKAKETLYTEEQVQKMIDDALINFGIGYKLANNFVQSLKQPKKD